MRRMVCLLAAALLLCLAACGRTEAPAPAPDPAEPEELAAALVNAYADGEDTQALLARLEVKDPAQAALWGGILDYWRYVDSEMPINVQTLPDALPEDDSLCIVVLGFQLNPDGSLQPELVGRLETAMVCARRYPEASVLCTGGPTAWNAPELSEAGQMGAWLVEHGLAPGRLLTEPDSRTTTENAVFSCALLQRERPQVRSVLLVSSDYHIPWGAVLFEAAFRLSGAPMRVTDNCAWRSSASYGAREILNWQRSGLLQLLRY